LEPIVGTRTTFTHAELRRTPQQMLALRGKRGVKRDPHMTRLDALEAVLKPKGKLFVFVYHADEDGSRAEREAAFRAEHGVRPHDELVTIILKFQERA
jgi:hypothetical protein